MATGRPDPVESWAPMFTRSFSDEQIIRDAVSRSSGGLWCRLCDSPVTGESADAHTKLHERELATWRKRRRKESDVERDARLADARTARKLQKDAEAAAAKVIEEELRPRPSPKRKAKVRRKR